MSDDRPYTVEVNLNGGRTLTFKCNEPDAHDLAERVGETGQINIPNETQQIVIDAAAIDSLYITPPLPGAGS